MGRLETAWWRNGDEAPFELASLSSTLTGLPMVVWVAERYGGREEPYLMAGSTSGDSARLDGAVMVSITPLVEAVDDATVPPHLARLRSWVDLNRAAIIDYWNNELSTSRLLRRLRPIS